MKRYPKKYYATSSAQSAFGQGSCLFSHSFSVVNPSLDDIAALLLLQVFSGYIPQSSSVGSIILDCHVTGSHGSLWAHYLSGLTTNFKHLAAIGLGPNDIAHISLADHSTRHVIKYVAQSLIAAGCLKQGLVSYFWDFDTGCSVADYDVTWVPRARKVHRIRCFIDSKKESIVLHVHEQHLLFGVVAVAVDPEDRRYRKLIGKKVIIPIINRIVPIIADASVSSTVFNGIKPIIPCHDRLSLTIAQRHHLPCDVYAIDANGVFTNHAAIYAGKDHREFSDNIIQYLQDIHNYDGVDSTSVDVPFCSQTQKYLGFFSGQGWTLLSDMFTQQIVDFISSDSFVANDSIKRLIISGLESSDPIIVSSSSGLVGLAYFGDNTSLYDIVLRVKKKLPIGYRSLSLLLLDMCYDGIIPLRFVIEDCIDAIFITPDFLSTYLDFLDNLFVDDKIMREDVRALRDLCSAGSDDTQIVDAVMYILDSVGLWSSYGNHYSLSPLLISGHVFVNSLFIRMATSYIVYERELWTGDSRLSLAHDGFTNLFIGQSIVDLVMLHKLPSCTLLPTLGSVHGGFTKNFVQPLSYYSSDTLRIALIHGNVQDIASQELVVQKIWNVCRYVYMDVIASGMASYTSGIDLLALIQEDIHQLTPFDQRILYAFSDMYNKLQDINNTIFPLNNRIDLLCRCIVDDFAVKYIEVVKQRKGPLSHWVMLACVDMICQMIGSLFPAMVAQIYSLFGPILTGSVDVRGLQIPSKNYKIHLLMLIMGSLRRMKHSLLIKNHEQVDVCIQGSTDIASFLQDYRPLLDAIVKINDLRILGQDHDIPADYIQEHVIDIALGLKVHAQAIADIDRLYILLKEKNEYLQHLRALASLSHTSDKALKIEQLKEEIQELEYQIMKEKK